MREWKPPKVTLTHERDRHGRDRWRVIITDWVGGRRQRTAQTSRSEAEARRIYRAARAELKGRRLMSVGELRDLWLDDVGRRVRPATLRNYRALSGAILDLDELVFEVTQPRALELYRSHQEGRTPASHRQGLALIKLMWRWALDEGHIQSDPWRRVRPEGVPSRRKRQLRLDEARKLLEHCLEVAARPGGHASVRHGALAALMGLLLGIRPGEARAASGRDVDDGGALLWIDDGKTANAARCLEVPGVLAPLLAARAAEVGEGQLLPYGESWHAHRVARLCEGAAVPRITPHGLRGTHATLARQAGATSHLVAGQLGHAGPAVTERHYIEPRTSAAQQQGAVMRVLQGGRS